MKITRTIRFMLIVFSVFVICSSCAKRDTRALTYVFRDGPVLSEQKKAFEKYNSYITDMSTLPVSFEYKNEKYHGFGKDFVEISRSDEYTDDRITTKFAYEFDKVLKVDVLMTCYPEYAAFEWTLEYTNISGRNSENIKNLYCADMIFSGENPFLRGINGDGENGGSGCYSPYTVDLTSSKEFIRYSETGRPTEKNFPYFNLEYADGGTILAIGWPGCWNAEFMNEGNETTFVAGQKNFNAYLKPGETVRTPMMSFLYYQQRDEARAMNLWRNWYIDCNMRKIEDRLFEPALYGATSIKYSEMTHATEENQISSIDIYLNNDIPLNYWWMDAGWYFENDENSLSTWLPVGNWKVDTKRFPTKLKAISDHCAANNMKTLLWFEPELVRVDLNKLDSDGIKKEWLLDVEAGDWYLTDFGNNDFLNWLINRYSNIIDEGGISLYRQDWGFSSPVSCWLYNDEKNRTGITENHYVQGMLYFWDKLIELYPNMMIDTCASGGGRLDLETMRRAVPLHKTDLYYTDYTAKQAMHQSLFQWFPYFGTNEISGNADIYNLRSDYIAAIYVNFPSIASRSFDWEILQKACEEWKEVNKYFYSDYYQLIEWSNTTLNWRGWEFFDEEINEGFIQLFRDEKNTEENKIIYLKGLNLDITYEIIDFDGINNTTATGKSLMEDGITVSLALPKSSSVMLIKAKQ